MPIHCPFCMLPSERIVFESDVGVVIRDGYPVSKGHTLVIPKRHVASLFDLNSDERHALIDLVAEARKQLISEFKPDGLNLGVNDGQAAGQTVMHLHMHLIPRYAGDSPDPRGGVRWVFPERARYWDR